MFVQIGMPQGAEWALILVAFILIPAVMVALIVWLVLWLVRRTSP